MNDLMAWMLLVGVVFGVILFVRLMMIMFTHDRNQKRMIAELRQLRIDIRSMWSNKQ